MSEDILVVARTQPSLYEYLCQDFAEDPDVRVVMDRRRGERRRSGEAWLAERRRKERRTQPAIDDKLQSIGFAIVRLE